MTTRRWALQIEYDGTPFVGWQKQKYGLSVQDVVEAAAARLCGEPVAATAAGRTDAGVHAEGQMMHLDLPAHLPGERVRDALNFHMKPHPVAVLRAAAVAPTWHARFDAVLRTYAYVILNRPARSALARGRVWHVPRTLDVGAMAAAAAHLVGRHDFTSFRAAACQAKSPLRTLDRLEVLVDGERIRVVAEARSFLHHQVRNMVGTLKLVGEARWPAQRVADALAARDRAAAGPTAPPEGLYLTGVCYTQDPFGACND